MYTVGGEMENGKQYVGSPKKVKTELPHDPAILILNIYPKKMKSLSQKRYIYTPMFTETLFRIIKTWKQPKYLLTDEWIKKT